MEDSLRQQLEQTAPLRFCAKPMMNLSLLDLYCTLRRLYWKHELLGVGEPKGVCLACGEYSIIYYYEYHSPPPSDLTARDSETKEIWQKDSSKYLQNWLFSFSIDYYFLLWNPLPNQMDRNKRPTSKRNDNSFSNCTTWLSILLRNSNKDCFLKSKKDFLWCMQHKKETTAEWWISFPLKHNGSVRNKIWVLGFS